MCRVPLRAASSLVAVCLVLCAPVGASALTNNELQCQQAIGRAGLGQRDQVSGIEPNV